MKLNRERVTLAEKKLSVGLGAKPDLLQSKLDLNAQKAARLAELTLQEQLKEQLNRLVSFKQGTDYEVTDSIPINKNILITNVLNTAERFNPTLLVAQQNISIGAQYTAYDKYQGASNNYDGAGRNASDNNTLLLYAWFAF